MRFSRGSVFASLLFVLLLPGADVVSVKEAGAAPDGVVRPIGWTQSFAAPPRPFDPAPLTQPAPDVCADARKGKLHVTLAHFNDLQARYSDRIGGKSRYGYLAGALEAIRRDVPASFVLDAGDDYEKGAVAELFSMGAATRRMVHALPIDARVIGNHDFAYGEAAVLADVTTSPHPVLAANVGRPDGGPNPFRPFVKLDVGCLRVGVVGLVTGNYGADDKPTSEAFDGVFLSDDHYSAALEREVSAHRSEVDVMIALTHLGAFPDAVVATRVPGVDLVVGGHTEELFRTPRMALRKDGSIAYILQAGHWGLTFGRADLAFDPATKKLSIEKYRIVDVDGRLPFDERIGALADAVEAEFAPDAQKPIAEVKAPITQGTGEDELVWRAVQDRWRADALILGRDIFWRPINAGPLTLQRLYDALLVQREPAGTSGFTSLQIAEVSGQTLRALREHLLYGHAFFGPTAIDPEKSYKLVIEKRAALVPARAFRLPVAIPETTLGGEIVEVVADYARVQTARGALL